MEITDRERRRLPDDAEEGPREGLAAPAGGVLAPDPQMRPVHTRREVVARAVAGAAIVSIGGVAVPLAGAVPAGAQEDAPPEPTDEDLAAFAEAVELGLVEAYRAVAATGKLSEPVAAALALFAAHHTEHAAAVAGHAGTKATGTANAQFVGVVGDQIRNATDERSLLQIAYDLEGASGGTYLSALGTLEDEAALKVAASILPVESQHAVVLGQMLSRPLEDDVVPSFENQSRALDPARYSDQEEQS